MPICIMDDPRGPNVSQHWWFILPDNVGFLHVGCVRVVTTYTGLEHLSVKEREQGPGRYKFTRGGRYPSHEGQ